MTDINRLEEIANNLRFFYCQSSVEKLNHILEEIVSHHASDPTRIVAIQPVIEKMLQAMESSDSIALADLVEYELAKFEIR